MFGLGVTELVFIILLLLFFFGATRIPQIARGLGGAIRNFKGEMKREALEDPEDEDPQALPGDGEDRGRG